MNQPYSHDEIVQAVGDHLRNRRGDLVVYTNHPLVELPIAFGPSYLRPDVVAVDAWSGNMVGIVEVESSGSVGLLDALQWVDYKNLAAHYGGAFVLLVAEEDVEGARRFLYPGSPTQLYSHRPTLGGISVRKETTW